MPEEAQTLKEGDSEFTDSEYGKHIFWVADYRQNLYVPTYSDVLKTAFAAQFGKVKIGELVNYLSGKDPETREISQAFAKKTFSTLKEGIMDFMAEDNFKTFLDILNQGGWIRDRMIGSKAMMNAVYSVFLMMKKEGLSGQELTSAAMRWYLLSSLTGRYQTGVESTIAKDYSGIREKGTLAYLEELEREVLPASFWTETLPEKLKTTMVKSSVYSAYLAALVKEKEPALFCKTKTMQELISAQTDNTLLFSKAYLEKNGIKEKELYGQVANCMYLDKDVKSFLKRRPPVEYLKAMLEQEEPVLVGEESFTREEIRASLQIHAIPTETSQMTADDFEVFLAKRRQLMAEKIQAYYRSYQELVK
jgi:hypothetical protein